MALALSLPRFHEPSAYPDKVSLASIVIPAYNEGRVISRCLQALKDSGLDVEIVVAANGCTDDTAARAAAFPGVTVLEIPTPGKSGALNEGDAAAHAFPRIFLDADIVLGPGALAGMIDALTTDAPVVAAPAVKFCTGGAPWTVRQYYEIYSRTPYVVNGLIGLGVYGMSRAARARFEQFPSLTADDLFVQRLFDEGERITTPGWFEVKTPRNLADLVQVRTRVARGNTELAQNAAALPPGDFETTTGSTVKAIGRMVAANPRLAPAALLYIAVVAGGRLRAHRTAPGTWNRDESTR